MEIGERVLANGSMFKKRKKWRETFPASFLTQQSPRSLSSLFLPQQTLDSPLQLSLYIHGCKD